MQSTLQKTHDTWSLKNNSICHRMIKMTHVYLGLRDLLLSHRLSVKAEALPQRMIKLMVEYTKCMTLTPDTMVCFQLTTSMLGFF